VTKASVPRPSVWTIQILRLIAAAMVLFGHLNHEVTQRPDIAVGFVPLAPVWWPGGVDIFFVISGFIMFTIASDKFGVAGAARNFLVRRLVRLVPPYWAFTALALLAMTVLADQMAIHSFTAGQVAGSLLFIPTANPQGLPFPILILGWTLNFEMLFYAIFACGLVLSPRRGLVFIHLALAALALASAWAPLPLPWGSWCNPIVLEFLYGIHIARWRRQGVSLPAWACVALIAGAVVALVLAQSTGIAGTAWTWRFVWAGLPSAMLVCGFAFLPVAARPEGALRALTIGGDASYILYLSHPFVLSAFAMGWSRLHLAQPQAYVATGFVACMVASVALHLWVEKPLHRRLERALA